MCPSHSCGQATKSTGYRHGRAVGRSSLRLDYALFAANADRTSPRRSTIKPQRPTGIPRINAGVRTGIKDTTHAVTASP